jgi:hypothetical protein
MGSFIMTYLSGRDTTFCRLAPDKRQRPTSFQSKIKKVTDGLKQVRGVLTFSTGVLANILLD